jgi:hypothetical protein
LAVVAVTLAARQASAQGIDAYKDRLASAISNKTQDFKDDQTTDIRALGRVVGKRGKEYTGKVTTKGAEITGRREGTDFNLKLIFSVKLPFEADSTLKNFIGVGFEYRSEQKHTTGVFTCTVEVGFGGVLVKDQKVVNPSEPGDHYSIKMPLDTIEAHFFNADYLKGKLFP